MPDVQTNSEEYAYANSLPGTVPGTGVKGVQSLGSVVEDGTIVQTNKPFTTRNETEATFQDQNPWDAASPQSGQAMTPEQAASIAPGITDDGLADALAGDIESRDTDHSAQIPNRPVITSAVAGATGHAQVTWTEAPDADGYALSGYHVTATSSDGGVAGAANVAGNVLTADVAGLTPTKHYTFTVHATNQAGSSPESAASGVVIVA